MVRLEDLVLEGRGLEGRGLERRGLERRGPFGGRAVPRSPRLLSCAVPQASFRWITGPSGAGKSALLDVVGGARRPVAARAIVLDTDLRCAGRAALARLRRRLGMVRDDPDLVPDLTLGENILLPLLLRGNRTGPASRDVLDVADWLGFADRLDRRADAASRGERQLCAVARAVSGRPDLVLADEPTMGLGERDGARVILLLAELARLGATVLVATREDWTRRLHEAPEIALAPSSALART